MLKKLVIAGAIVAVATGSALVQNKPNVEIFGRLDIGVINANNLGGENSAGVLLESQINLGDGTQGVSSGLGADNDNQTESRP